ncbi:MAG: arylsulfatase A-like enzyme [Candidatus Azotimanducaceae bacterium]|jgi:arylsulfatase A-like enzyme
MAILKRAGFVCALLSCLQAVAAELDVIPVQLTDSASKNSSATDYQAPNIVLLLADDLGFSDIGAFGSEVSTPNIDALAARGMMFSNYHTGASCAPTRAMLMTGISSHRAGLGNMPESLPSEARGVAEYSGHLRRGIPTVADHLSERGYRTYMAGKWHLGKEPDTLPSARGFDRTFVLADTGADNWEQRPYLPMYDKANWYADGQPTTLPDDFYSSKTLVDKTIEFINTGIDTDIETNSRAPFFAYVAFQAVHIPVQAPKEFTDKYLHTYTEGWSELRKQRYQGAIDAGVIQAGLTLEKMNTTADWDALTTAEKRYEAKSMAVYAGMIEAMDFHIGRLIEHLKATGQFDNTVFVFTSDNGAEPSDPLDLDASPIGGRYFKNWLKNTGYSTQYKTLGEKGSYNVIGPSFASAAVSPLSFYKFFNGEGGMRVPLIIAGPAVSSGLTRPGLAGPGQDNKARSISEAFTFVTDLVPTMLSIANAEPIAMAEGKSLIPIISGTADRVRSDSDTVGFELGGNMAFFQGDYKLIRNRGPVGDNEWHLYNIQQDPTESSDLRAQLPERFATMKTGYKQYALDHGVLEMPENYDQRKQLTINATSRALKVAAPFLVLGSAIFILLLILGIRYRRRNHA